MKAKLVQSLEDRLAKAEKVKSYAEAIRATTVRARKIAKDNLAKVEAEKQKTEDKLTHMHDMLKKEEAARD